MGKNAFRLSVPLGSSVRKGLITSDALLGWKIKVTDRKKKKKMF